MFEDQREQLLKLKKRYLRLKEDKDVQEIFEIEQQFEKILSTLVDAGLNEPLESKYLLDIGVLGEKYHKFLDEYSDRNPFTIFDLITKSRNIVVATIISKITGNMTQANIEIHENLKGYLEGKVTITLLQHMMAFPHQKPGERTLLFLGPQKTLELDVGRMLIDSSRVGSTVTSFPWGKQFWPDSICKTPKTEGSNLVYVLGFEDVRKLILSSTASSNSVSVP